MQRLQLLLRLLPFLLLTLFFTACEEDDPFVPTERIPSISFDNSGNYLNSDATVDAGTFFEVKVSASKGDDFLRTVTVYEDDIKISDYTNRLTYNGTAFEANPKLLTDMEKDGFEWVIGIKAHEDADATKEYRIEITDEAGSFNSVELNISTQSQPPILTLVEAAPYFWDTASLDLGARFEIKLDGTAGTSPLSTLEIKEDGETISDLTRIRYDAVDFGTNPMTLPSDDQNMTDAIISIKAQESGGAKTYTLFLTDAAGAVDSASIVVVTGTAITSFEGKLLLNAGGGVGTGGLNLLTGVGTGSNDPNAHIKDLGIDLSKPLAENWKQKIAGVNGSELRVLGSSTPETFSFENIEYKEEIVGLFDNGTTITESEKVQKDDVFIVQNGTDYFLL